MTDELHIGVAVGGREAFAVTRSDSEIAIGVRDPSAGRFGVARSENELHVWAEPGVAAAPVQHQLIASVYWTGNLGYPDPDIDEAELEAFLAYEGADIGHWDGEPYTALVPRCGYTAEIKLNANWRSLGVRTAYKGEGDVFWPIPEDAEVTYQGSYQLFVVRAPALVDAGIPSLKTLGGFAYHPAAAFPGLDASRNIDMTRNYALNPTSFSPPFLMEPANWPTWPPAW